jgi:chromosome segregation ATPase
MPTQAKVTSIEALESFRASLLVYVAKTRPALEEVSADTVRLRGWIEGQQRAYWDNEVRKRTRALQEAQQALFSAKLSNLRKESAAEINAVHRARRALDEAVNKVRVLKQWTREFESRVDPLVKQMEKLQTFLSNDLIKAAAYLAEVVKTLDAYAGVKQVPNLAAEPAAAPTPGAAAREKAGQTPAPLTEKSSAG